MKRLRGQLEHQGKESSKDKEETKKNIKRKKQHVKRDEEKMKRGRQEEIIKQRKDTYGGVGGEREGKMT